MIAELLGGVAEHHGGMSVEHGADRVVACTRAFERIAPFLGLALDVACLACYAGHILELVVVGLQLVIGDAPVLDGAVRGDRLRAVAPVRARPDGEVARLEAPRQPLPLDARATHSGAGQERSELA